ncbi:MAG TPA: exonuclease domain-containing protein [Acidimicrobiales bacterium]|nr:exonuclease domain-containing protein [Acidimicrobiales bacterium]
MALAAASSSDDLSIPLYDVTFAVVDVETTGGGPETCALTEIAAAKFRGGACLGTFATLVDPCDVIPPFITSLTGITNDMVRDAPSLPGVLPAFVEFVHGAVIVGHNVSFDLAFLNAALEHNDRFPLDNLVVDTLALARRLAAEEIPNCKLGTLASALELEHRPAHRALDDVMATADLLHRLIEDATGFGVFQLGQLVELPQFIPTVVRGPSRRLRAFL